MRPASARMERTIAISFCSVRGLLVHMLHWFADAGEDPRTMAADGIHNLKNAQRLFAERHRVRAVHLHKGVRDAPFRFFHIDVAPARADGFAGANPGQ